MTDKPQEERRKDDGVLGEIQRTVNATRADVLQARSELKSQKSLVERVIRESFPNGDYNAHRLAHEAMIKKEEHESSFWRELRLQLVKYGLIGFVGWLAVQAWLAFLKGPTP